MVRLSYEGNILDVSEEAALSWAIGNMISPLELVGGIHWILNFGMPSEPATKFLGILDRNILDLEQNRQIVDDPALRRSIDKILPTLTGFVENAQEIMKWQQSSVSREALSKHREIVKTGGPSEPPWYSEREFQEIISRFGEAYRRYIEVLEIIIKDLKVVAERVNSQDILHQLDYSAKKIPPVLDIINLGYREAIRRGAEHFDDTQSG